MAGHGPDGEVVAVEPDVVQVGQVVDVDQQLGPGQAELHHRQQAVAAGDEPGLRPVAFEQASAWSTLVARSYSNGAGVCM